MKTISYDTHSAAPFAQTRVWGFETLSSGWTGFKTKSATAIKRLQTARMVTALQSMSDEQLDMIGLARADIRAHADKLISEE